MNLFDTKKINQEGFTLLELIIILLIIGVMMSIVVTGVMKFRQVIIISNTSKEVVLYLNKARRNSINNVVSKVDGTVGPTSGYFFRIDEETGEYYLGACNMKGQCSSEKVKSQEYGVVNVSECGGNSVVGFKYVTGELIFQDVTNGDPNFNSASATGICEITISIDSGFINTERKVVVDAEGRNIRHKL